MDSFQVIQNTVRLLRVISEPGGHIVLSGESGNCRQSMVVLLQLHITDFPGHHGDVCATISNESFLYSLQVRLAAFIYDMKLSILDDNDITNEPSWRRILRSVVR